MKVTIENPWWNSGGLWQDPDLLRVKSSPLNYYPRPFSPEECKSPNVFTLRGPRRAGKTVALKLLIAQLIEKEDWNPKHLLWTTFETVRTLAQAEEHLLEVSQKFRPHLLFIDEVTALTGWQRVIKKLRDNGVLSQTCLILTGSSAHDLKAGAERMAGRRGGAANPDRVLLPMSFRDFQTQLRQSNLNVSSSIPTEHALARAFLKVGGFPFRVERFILDKKNNQEWDEISDFQIFDDVFFYEFIRRRLDRSIAIEVLGRLANIGCSAMSYEGFAKQISVSRDTARKYLDALGDAFLLSTFNSYDTSRNRVAPKKDKKFAWIDPALGYLGNWLKQAEPPLEASLAEWAVGAELLRRHEVRLWEGLSAPRSIFTWKSSSGNEIDFLWVDKSKKLKVPFEVKYQNSISDWDFQVMERAFGNGVMITPEVSRERQKSRAMTLSQFLLEETTSLQQISRA